MPVRQPPAQHPPAKHPVTVLAGPYAHPLHPMLVTVPIGAWVASLVFDASSHFAASPGFLVRSSLWLIGIGLAGALAAALTGVLDLLAIPAGTRAHGTALTHMCINLCVAAAYAINFGWRYGSYHHPVLPGQLALSAASLAALAVSGYLGGKLAYRYGVRVADETTQSEGYLTSPLPAPEPLPTRPRLSGRTPPAAGPRAPAPRR